MVASPRMIRFASAVPPLAAVLAGVAAAAAVAFMPSVTLEDWMWATGIASLVPAAAPPLGGTARLLLAGGSAAVVAAVAWSALYLIFGPGGLLAPKPDEDGMPAVRRGDAHPDAPPRRPMSAADLGTPLMEVAPAERPVPADLDQPLAAFDPAAILAAPREPVRPVAPLAAPAARRTPALEPGERMETFEITPVVRFGTQRTEPASPQTIESLLRRLEESAGRRTPAG